MSMRTIQVMHVHEVKHDQDCVCVHCLRYEYIYTYLRISTFLDFFFSHVGTISSLVPDREYSQSITSNHDKLTLYKNVKKMCV